MPKNVPKVDTGHICIADKENTVLAAVVSSYFAEEGIYLPLFVFPNVGKVSESEADDFQEDGYIARSIGNIAAVMTNNAMARMDECKLVILVGLNEYQKSYLRIPSKVPVIEVDDMSQVEEKLLHISSKKEVLECRSEDVLNALFLARKSGKRLSINENATTEAPAIEDDKGIVVLEKSEEALAVVAVNYAHAVDANLLVVEGFGKENRHGVEKNIQKWRDSGSHNQLQKALNKVSQRVGSIDFDRLKYATFFTVGLPYSLGIKNVIPCSYVHLSLRPDLFIINSILFESVERFNSAVVFSPGFFHDEETKNVVDMFRKNHYYVRPLVNNHATVRNLDFHAQHFPYDILHICTHGGEVDGYAVTETFRDREGVEHTVEYDEVVGFAPVPGKDLIEVHRKLFFRKFDGFAWMSPELKAQKYPNYVYEDMRKGIFQNEDNNKPTPRVSKEKIPASCAIACIDSIHQGMFQILASHSSPLVFNNACWSWSEVATFFLANGARGYIGTLWDIGNAEAVLGANTFYSHLFDKGVLAAFFEATKAIKGTESEDIYVYWGLHFSTLGAGVSLEKSRDKVFRELLRSFFAWSGKVATTKSKTVKKNSIEVLKSIHTEIINNFKPSDLEKLEKEMQERMSENPPQTRSAQKQSEGEELSVQELASIEHPVEFRKTKG